MFIIDKIKSFFNKNKVQSTPESNVNKGVVFEQKTQNVGQNHDEDENIVYEDVWNHIDPAKNTQAHHILSVMSFDEWIDMDDLRIRVKQMFFIEYKNEKSLYPYIKTLTDIGLLESTSVGGKRKWRKKEIIIKVKARDIIKLENRSRVKL